MPEPGDLDPYPGYWQNQAEFLREEIENKIAVTRLELDLSQPGLGERKAKILLPEFKDYFNFVIGWLTKISADIEADPVASTRDSKIAKLLEDVLDELVSIRGTLHSPVVNTTQVFDYSTELPDFINKKTAQITNKLVALGVDEDDLGQFKSFLKTDSNETASQALNKDVESGKISSSLTPNEVLGEDSLIPLEEL